MLFRVGVRLLTTSCITMEAPRQDTHRISSRIRTFHSISKMGTRSSSWKGHQNQLINHRPNSQDSFQKPSPINIPARGTALNQHNGTKAGYMYLHRTNALRGHRSTKTQRNSYSKNERHVAIHHSRYRVWFCCRRATWSLPNLSHLPIFNARLETNSHCCAGSVDQ